MKGKAKIPEWKKNEVEDIKNLVLSHPIFGIVDLESLPTLQLQQLRIKLKDKLRFKMAKKRLIRKALEQLKDKKPNMDKVEHYLKGMPALVFTSESPFKLYKSLSSNRSKAGCEARADSPNGHNCACRPHAFRAGPGDKRACTAGHQDRSQGRQGLRKERHYACQGRRSHKGQR